MSLTDNQFGEALGVLVADFRDNESAGARAAFITAVEGLFEQAGILLPARLAAVLQGHVTITEEWVVQFRAWAAGTHNGGPSSNGYYPIVDRNGTTVLIPSPAKIRSELFGLTPRGRVDVVEDLDALTDAAMPGDIYIVEETGHAWTRTVEDADSDDAWLDLGAFRGPSTYDVWLLQPGNAGKTQADYFTWLANAQKGEVQPLLDAALAARNDAEAAAASAADDAAQTAADRLATAQDRVDAQAAATAAQTSNEAADGHRVAAQGSAQTATTKAGEAAASATASDTARAAAVVAKDDAVVAKDTAVGAAQTATTKAADAEAARAAAVIAKDDAVNQVALATTQADAADVARIGAIQAKTDAEGIRTDTGNLKDQAQALRDQAQAFRNEAEGFRNEAGAIAGGDFQPRDATLDALAALNGTSGVLEQTGPDTFVKRTDLLSAAQADARFRQLGDIPQAQVTGLVAALASKATSADISAALANLIGMAPVALDTWAELVTAIQNDASALTALTNVVNGKASQADLNALTAIVNGKVSQAAYDAFVTATNNALAGKAAINHAHEISHINGLTAALADAGKVKTVNGEEPDEDGNIEIQAGGTSSDEHIQGLLVSPSPDAPKTSLSISVGRCRDRANEHTLVLAAPISKSITAVWAAGNGAGGRDRAAPFVAGDTVFAHLIYNPTTQATDALLSSSPLKPTLPAGWTASRLVFSGIVLNASGEIPGFDHDGTRTKPDIRGTEFIGITNGVATGTLRDYASLPVGLKVNAYIYHSVTNAGGSNPNPAFSGVYDPDQGVPQFGVSTQHAQFRIQWTNVSDRYETAEFYVETNNNAQLYTASNDTGEVMTSGVIHWDFNRDRFSYE